MTSADIVAALVRANLALAGGLLAVLLLRKPVRRWFGSGMAYALWSLAPVALAACLIPARRITLPMPEVVAPFAPMPATITQPAVTQATELPVASVVDPTTLILLLWLAGIAVGGAWLAWSQRRFGQEAAKGLAGPAVVGILAPRIIVPADFETRFDATERAMILAHEQIHLDRQDARINAMTVLIQCLCWFNPLVHLAARAMRIDQEIACDAAVRLSLRRSPRAYAEALIKSQLAHTPLPLGCYWPAGTQHPLMERIAMLNLPTPSRLRRLAGATGLATLALAAGGIVWAAQPPRLVASLAPKPAVPLAATKPSQSAVAARAEGNAPAPEAPLAENPITLLNVEIARDGGKALVKQKLTTVAHPAPVRLLSQAINDKPATPTNAAAAALGSPAQSRTAGSSSTATVRPGEGGGPSAPAAVTNPPANNPFDGLTGPPPNAAPGSFIAQFNGNSPVLVHGKLVGVEWADPNSFYLVSEAGTGKLYRVQQGHGSNVSAEGKANVKVGTDVIVRGYNAWDASCTAGCLVNGRDVTLASGEKLVPQQYLVNPPVCTEQVLPSGVTARMCSGTVGIGP